MLTFIIDGQRIDGSGKSITFTDPGGCETCAITAPFNTSVAPGAKVIVSDGVKPLWIGYVEEPGTRSLNSANGVQIGGVGAKLDQSRDYMSVVYVDRALDTWVDPGDDRKLSLLTSGYSIDAPSIGFDAAHGASIQMPIQISSTAKSLVETWYDAGMDNAIAAVYFTYEMNPVDTSLAFTLMCRLSESDNLVASHYDDCTNFHIAGTSGSGSNVATKHNRRFAEFSWYYNNVGADSDIQYTMFLRNVVVIGDHLIPISLDASLNTSIDPSDIIRDVLRRSGFKGDLRITDSYGYTIQALSYKTKVLHQQVLDDMVKLTGWHLGIWPPDSFLSSNPVAIFSPPPTDVTATVDFYELQNPDLSERYSGMNSKALVTYTTANGKQQFVMVMKQHPRLEDGDGGTLLVDAGTVGSSDVAAAYGIYSLTIDQAQSRVSGSVILPSHCRTLNSGVIPSHYLRPGIDRLRITGLPVNASILGGPPERVDSFRISRLTVEEQDGRLVTTAELDQGADLIEVLQARFAAVDPTGSLSSG